MIWITFGPAKTGPKSRARHGICESVSTTEQAKLPTIIHHGPKR
jgi:hypothetical protein